VDNVIQLGRRWELGEQLGKGGFGRVFAAEADDGTPAAVKLVPKEPGAARELLFADLTGVRNVVPVLESGETGDDYVIVMPRATESLADRLDATGGALPLQESLAVLTDVAAALTDLEGRVVHRDLKPQNVLLVDGVWCLADFGISRYTEAATATHTHKWSGTSEYTAPERWRSERATAATDVYALGVMAFQVLSGNLPFPGPETADFRDQHLHADPPRLTTASPRLAALVEECLYKAPGARPSPANLLARLQRAAAAPVSPGAAALAEAYQRQAEQRRAAEVAASRAQTEQARRRDLADAARRSLEVTAASLLEAVTDLAPGAAVRQRPDGGWTVELGPARLGMSTSVAFDERIWGTWAPQLTVIAVATISVVVVPADRSGYEGRSHSLYFCDARHEGEYAWYETAFMDNPIMGRSRRAQEPFALHLMDPIGNPAEAAGKALSNAMTEYQVAWPFTELTTGETEEFTDRWVGWFADAVDGRLARPMMLPERRPEGTWRRS